MSSCPLRKEEGLRALLPASVVERFVALARDLAEHYDITVEEAVARLRTDLVALTSRLPECKEEQ